jgi:hypothetical protein
VPHITQAVAPLALCNVHAGHAVIETSTKGVAQMAQEVAPTLLISVHAGHAGPKGAAATVRSSKKPSWGPYGK